MVVSVTICVMGACLAGSEADATEGALGRGQDPAHRLRIPAAGFTLANPETSGAHTPRIGGSGGEGSRGL